MFPFFCCVLSFHCLPDGFVNEQLLPAFCLLFSGRPILIFIIISCVLSIVSDMTVLEIAVRYGVFSANAVTSMLNVCILFMSNPIYASTVLLLLLLFMVSYSYLLAQCIVTETRSLESRLRAHSLFGRSIPALFICRHFLLLLSRYSRAPILSLSLN